MSLLMAGGLGHYMSCLVSPGNSELGTSGACGMLTRYPARGRMSPLLAPEEGTVMPLPLAADDWTLNQNWDNHSFSPRNLEFVCRDSC